MKLTFDKPLAQGEAFFRANPTALQLLEFKGDPKVVPPTQAFRPLPYRVIVEGNTVVVDSTLIGAEAQGGTTSTGLPSSIDNVTANIRLAIPTQGVIGRQLRLGADPVSELNGVDSRGDQAVIRDFRSGNADDGRIGALADIEPPMLVANVAMGITAIDVPNRILTLNKRFSTVTVRGRIPFVDGGLDPQTGFPVGGPRAPTVQPLRSGDAIFQSVLAQSGETVLVRAEVLQNLDVGSIVGDPPYPNLGLAIDGTDGGNAPTVRVRVASLSVLDSTGREVPFESSTLPLGQDCTVQVRYYEHVPYAASASTIVSDAQRRADFLTFDPAPPFLDANRVPIPRGTMVSPLAGVGLRFSEPMDLERVEPFDNYLLTNATFTEANAGPLLTEPKPTSLSVIATRLLDQDRNGTVLRLTTPLGLNHVNGTAERYFFHMLLGDGGVTDLAGNSVDLFDRRLEAPTTFSVGFTLNPTAEDNLIGWRVHRFSSADEDGTKPGALDYFGQFQLRNGRIYGAETTRFSKVADDQTLPNIRRDDKGECAYFDTVPNPDIWLNAAKCPQNPPGQLYLTPNMTATNLQPPLVFTPPPGPRVFGGIVEPFNPRGSRLQMTYREDDFDLGYHDASTMLIDVEQVFWAPWNNDPLQFDQFDRVTLALGHADVRPDISFQIRRPWSPPPPPVPCCELDCASLNSGLGTTFSDNVLQGSSMVEVVTDKVFTVNPNDAFRSSTGTTMVPYPRFARSYTWRDSRLVSWDRVNNRPIGLGGAKQPEGQFPARDRTAKVSSPWIRDEIPKNGDVPIATQWVRDLGDFGEGGVFSGTAPLTEHRSRDHDPIALPLLMDFKVYPDDARNGIASGVNLFHIAYVGQIWPGTAPLGNGYYNAAGLGICGNLDWPTFRVHTSGGVDGLGAEVIVDLPRTTQATGGWIKDVGLGDPIQGRAQTKAGDDHLPWAQADFVRRVSMVTFGFFDTRRPNLHALQAGDLSVPWEGVAAPNGFPDFVALGTTRGGEYAIADMVSIVDPPSTQQPPGTAIRIEYRFAENFLNPVPYDLTEQTGNDRLLNRGNLMNPNYACEAYRYASPNGPSEPFARINAERLTEYVIEEEIPRLRDEVTGTLPRYANMRIIFENNTAVTPAVSPSLRSMAVVYRMARR